MPAVTYYSIDQLLSKIPDNDDINVHVILYFPVDDSVIVNILSTEIPGVNSVPFYFARCEVNYHNNPIPNLTKCINDFTKLQVSFEEKNNITDKKIIPVKLVAIIHSRFQYSSLMFLIADIDYSIRNLCKDEIIPLPAYNAFDAVYKRTLCSRSDLLTISQHRNTCGEVGDQIYKHFKLE
jgi:hypothetical protein